VEKANTGNDNHTGTIVTPKENGSSSKAGLLAAVVAELRGNE
jgi:hypothetical protein